MANGYFYIFYCTISPYVKLGVTCRHVKHRLKEHQTAHATYVVYKVIKLFNTEMLDKLEDYCKEATQQYNPVPEKKRNECRYSIHPQHIVNLAWRFIYHHRLKHALLDDYDLQFESEHPDLPRIFAPDVTMH